jgi:uncharacterized protein (TIGR00369 family)
MHELNNHPLILAYIRGNHFGSLIGMDFNILDRGKIEYKLKIEEKHLATLRAAHGGCLAALVDALLGVSALSAVCEQGKVVSTVEFKLNFLRPALLGDILIGQGSVVKAGNRIVFTEGQIINQHGEIVVTASGTFNAYPKEKAGY